MVPVRRFLVFILLGCIALPAISQSTRLTGKVLNEKNEPLQSVSVKIVGGGGTATDIEGRFSLILLPGKKYEIEFSAIGYSPKTINEVEVFSNQVNEVNVTLEVKAQTSDAVVVTAKTNRRLESVNSIISFQKNTNTV